MLLKLDFFQSYRVNGHININLNEYYFLHLGRQTKSIHGLGLKSFHTTYGNSVTTLREIR